MTHIYIIFNSFFPNSGNSEKFKLHILGSSENLFCTLKTKIKFQYLKTKLGTHKRHCDVCIRQAGM